MRIGIDLGGTTVKAALCAADGTLLRKQSAPYADGGRGRAVRGHEAAGARRCARRRVARRRTPITSIGIGVPGSFDKATCTLKFGTNLGMSNVCFADAFRPEFGCTVQLDNDANCAALGEVDRGRGEEAHRTW